MPDRSHETAIHVGAVARRIVEHFQQKPLEVIVHAKHIEAIIEIPTVRPLKDPVAFPPVPRMPDKGDREQPTTGTLLQVDVPRLSFRKDDAGFLYRDAGPRSARLGCVNQATVLQNERHTGYC